MPILRRLHVAYPGQHISKAGQKVGLDPADIAELAASYSPEKHQCAVSVNDVDTAIALGAPVVLGHFDPRTVEAKGIMPAFGSVTRAYAEDSNLYLDVSLTDNMARWIEQGLYGRVSLSWYGANDPRNPTPGKKHIRHLGFHGAEPVSLKNLTLPDVEFLEFSESMEIENDDLEFAEEDSEMTTTPANPREALINLLTWGSRGYKGEITGFIPEPNEKNNYLYDQNKNQFVGQFVDESGYEREVYEFVMKEEDDGSMTRTYRRKMAGDETELSEMVIITEGEYETMKQKLADLEAEVEFGETQISLSQEEYEMLKQKAASADYLMEMEKQRMMEQKVQQIVGYLVPLQNAGLIRADAELSRIAQYIAIVGGDAMEGMEPLEFSESGEVDQPADVVLGLLADLSANIGNLQKVEKDVPVEFGELPVGTANYRQTFSLPAGVGVDEGQAKLHNRVVEFCESKGLNPKNNGDYLSALRSVVGNV